MVVIGAGQAGLSTAWALARQGFEPETGFVVLDADERARRRVAAPLAVADRGHHPPRARPARDCRSSRPATRSRPPTWCPPTSPTTSAGSRCPCTARSGSASVHRRRPVPRAHGRRGTWTARALVNATGTWTRPFVPRYPGQELFRGRQLHTVDYRGPPSSPAGTSSWSAAAPRPPSCSARSPGSPAPPGSPAVRRCGGTARSTRTPDARAVALVEDAVREGRRPGSVVGVTGLRRLDPLRPGRPRPRRARAAADVRPDHRRRRGVGRRPVRARRRRPLGHRLPGRRLDHLAPLHLRGPGGGIRMDGTAVAGEPRIHLVGYGPSASTIGANRAGQSAARRLRRLLGPDRALPAPPEPGRQGRFRVGSGRPRWSAGGSGRQGLPV